jgi:hypothetical protein
VYHQNAEFRLDCLNQCLGDSERIQSHCYRDVCFGNQS